MKKNFAQYFLSLMIMFCMPALATAAFKPSLIPTLLEQAEQLNPKVLEKALIAYDNARARNVTDSFLFTIIDYSRPSSEKRMWVFDLENAELLYEEWVSHGEGSGELYARRFSNKPESRQSSLGLFKTEKPYYGRNGYSLRLDGLEPNINHLAKKRGIVIHGADYAAPQMINIQGRLGRSHGCPVVREKINRELIDTIKNGTLVFIYYPDNMWLVGSKFLNGNARS